MVERSVEAGWSLADLQALLADHGVGVECVEPVCDWAPGAEAQDNIPLARLIEIARALEGRTLLASTADGGHGDDLAELAELAADAGLTVGVEFLGWGPVTSLPGAWQLVLESGRDDVGLIYDTWHQRRGSGRDNDVSAVPADRIIGVQLADGPSDGEPDPILEARFRRLLPGDGAMDIPGQLGRLAAHGVRAPIGVEVWAEGNQRDPVAAAKRAMAALQRVMARASAR